MAKKLDDEEFWKRFMQNNYETTSIFSGKKSKAMWRHINKSKSVEDLQDALYFVCCRLQEFEDFVRYKLDPKVYLELLDKAAKRSKT